jgi:hypothetical protein
VPWSSVVVLVSFLNQEELRESKIWNQQCHGVTCLLKKPFGKGFEVWVLGMGKILQKKRLQILGVETS